MRVFITGIEGFVGRHLGVRLTADGHEVVGSVLAEERLAGAPGAVVAFDVRDAAAVARAIGAAGADAVVHLAGEASVGRSFADPATTFAVNADGALNVLEACRKARTGRVLLVTSCEVYGAPDPDRGPVAEAAPLAPISPYGASKAAQDLLGQQYWLGYRLPVVRARPFPHTGPGHRPPYLFPSVARRIAEAEAGSGAAEIAVGAVDVVRDLLDVRDVVDAYARLLEAGRPGAAYNVATGRAREMRVALGRLLDLARAPVRLTTDPERRRPADFAWLVGDPARLEEATGWRPRIAWETTVEELLDEQRSRVPAPAGGR